VNRNLGRQFTVYRGIAGEQIKPAEVRDPGNFGQDGIGIHWTTNRGVAKRFAREQSDTSFNKSKGEGTVIHGRLVKGAAYQPYSDEWQTMASIHGVEGPEGWEREVTAKPGAKVEVTGITHVKNRGPKGGAKSRTIKFKQPREVRA
jgi:hypothetical protein